MKNTFKKIFSFALVLVMLFGSATAFAAEEDKTLNWDVYNGGYIYEFEYAGDFSGDKLVIDDGLEGQEYIEYYEIDIPQAGYYVVSIKRISGYYSDILFPESIEKGVAYGEAESKYLGEEIENEIYTFNYLYYFSAGENVLGLIYSDAAFEIEIEFVDEAVTDIEFEDGAFNGVFGCDILEDSGNGDMLATGINATIVFSSGKKIELDTNFVIEHEEPLVKGEHEAEVVFFNYREPVTVTIFEITDYIKSVEFKNPESITVKKYFNGDNGMIEFNGGEEFVVTFTDGTTVNTSDFVTLPNGKEYFIRSSVTGWWNEKPVIMVDVAQYTYGEYDVTAVEATLEENLQHLKDINSVRWAEANYDAQNSIEYLGYVDGFNEKLTVIFWFPTIYTSVIFDTFCNIVEFAEYYAAIQLFCLILLFKRKGLL